ncbi:hypothetical protein B9Z55_029108 [Caenorhabditis nigoni]|nr:hypothetical protein B9Z55_029108 [Caenorhabditis nigoni]
MEGEQLGEVLKRNRNFRFSNENCLRLSNQLVSALSHLHREGFMHRRINMNNILLKRSIDRVSKQEVVTLSVCGLSSARLITDQVKCDWSGWYTTYHESSGKMYAPRDDYISGFYVMAECAGFVLQRFVETTTEELKKLIHENPYRFFRGTDKWIARVLQIVDQCDKDGKDVDVPEIQLTLVMAIENFCPTSPIAWRIKNDQLKLL